MVVIVGDAVGVVAVVEVVVVDDAVAGSSCLEGVDSLDRGDNMLSSPLQRNEE